MTKIKSILLVDDDYPTNYLHTLLLKEWDIVDKIDTALNGQEALDFLKNNSDINQSPPTLILLDINMPVMNGFEFLEAYERLDDSLKASLVVCMLTTSLHDRDVQKAEQFDNLSGYMNKPLDRADLEAILQKLPTESFV